MGVAAIDIFACSRIRAVHAMLDEMLGGKPLPMLTQWVISFRLELTMVAVFFPAAALATFALRDRKTALSVLAFVIVFAIVHAFLIGVAMYLPMRWALMKRMGPGVGL